MPNPQHPHEFLTLEPVIKEYGSGLRISLHLHHPSRPFSKPREEPGLHLHFFALPPRFPWSSIIGESRLFPLPTAFGLPLREGTHRALILPNWLRKGVEVRDDQGHVLAYAQRKNVFILLDVAGQPGELAPLLLRHLLDRALEPTLEELAHLSGLHPERIQLILAALRRTTESQNSAWHEKRRALTRRQVYEGRMERTRDEISFLEAEVRSSEEALAAASLLTTAETRHLQVCRRRLRHLRGELLEDEADVARDLDRLSQHHEVADVTTSSAGLRIITRPIRAEHDGKLYALGTFQIDVLYNGQITIQNLTTRHGYYDHPHVWDGKPCLGNIREGLSKLIGELQLAEASEVLLDFLTTINPKDWHISIEHWGEIPPKERLSRRPGSAFKHVG